jgi:hypothetical protein
VISSAGGLRARCPGGSFAPTIVRRVEGGVRMSGRWANFSGAQHATTHNDNRRGCTAERCAGIADDWRWFRSCPMVLVPAQWSPPSAERSATAVQTDRLSTRIRPGVTRSEFQPGWFCRHCW